MKKIAFFKDKDKFLNFLTSLISIEKVYSVFCLDFGIKWDGKKEGRCVINGDKEIFCLSGNNVEKFVNSFKPFYVARDFAGNMWFVDWSNGEIKGESYKITNKIMGIDIETFSLSNNKNLAKKFFNIIGDCLGSDVITVEDNNNHYLKFRESGLYFPLF